MKSIWIAMGIVATMPLLAAAQAPGPYRSVIRPASHGIFAKGGCSSCATPVPTCTTCAPTCSTPMPAPSCGKCCYKPCLLESLRRGLRSLDCLLPCRLGNVCGSSCGSPCNSCTASCEVKPSCGSCCTKSRAHFFAFHKPKCGTPCAPMGCGCSTAMPTHMPSDMHSPPVPQPMPDDPFLDDKRPLDPNTPPPSRETYYRPYFKKNQATTKVGVPTPAKPITPAAHDPYAVAPPVHIKARPIQATGKVAQAEAVEYAEVRVAAHTAEPESLMIEDDEPPAPPMYLPVSAPRRFESAVPSNPLRR